MTRSKLVTAGGLMLAGCLAITVVTGCGSTAGSETAGATPGTSATASARGAASAGPAQAALGASGPGAAAADLHAIDGPAGFWFGSDSWPIPVGGRAPYSTPRIGGAYGGYVGMAGNWARWLGCSTGNFLAWSGANSQQADANYSRYRRGIGTGLYWYMGGPGVDPHWNGTTTEAGAWGARQAAAALAAAANDHVTYPVLFMDIEMPGIAPAPDNGWNDLYRSPCSGIVRSTHISAAVDRAEFNGFANYLTAHSRYKAGVYSEPGTWTQIFGTGSLATIRHIYEWTYEPETANLGESPRGWCLKGTSQCARFFGGVTESSGYAVMWQWSGGGGVRNPIGDFDQIDTNSLR